jgi:hypothetical protein
VIGVEGHEGAVELLALEGDRARLALPLAAAPGSRVPLAIDGRGVRLKIHRCVREGERYVVEGRFIDLPRDLRAALERASADREGASTP